jgi:16S rRNA (cytidine1402-2'-O)-methyltransferase
MTTTQQNTGTLFIVPTPIGNLEDITLRALRTLKEVDQICAEDTRHTRKLLTHFGISTPLLSYYREKEEERSRVILGLLDKGQDIALVSDAGTPAISDPGSILVAHAHKRGFRVVPLPGASAVTTAMSAAGISSDSFLFLGFAPSKKGQRIKFLSSLTNCEYPFILYESPRRVTQLLEDALEIFGDREAFWAREITKAFEDLRRGTISSLLEESEDTNRGEFVIIICPGVKEAVTGETLEDLLIWYRDNTDLSLKDVSKKLSSDLGLSRSKIYQQALELWK